MPLRAAAAPAPGLEERHRAEPRVTAPPPRQGPSGAENVAFIESVIVTIYGELGKREQWDRLKRYAMIHRHKPRPDQAKETAKRGRRPFTPLLRSAFGGATDLPQRASKDEAVYFDPSHSIPFHSVPFGSVPFRSVPFRSVTFLPALFLSVVCMHGLCPSRPLLSCDDG